MSEAIKAVGRPWKPGKSGNPNGRPVGARGRFSERFVSDISDAWAKHGAAIVEQMATTEPIRFAELCARLIPKDVQISLSDRLPGNLSPDDWSVVMEVLQAVKGAVPNVDERQAGEVLQLTLDAIRAHSAKVVDSQDGD